MPSHLLCSASFACRGRAAVSHDHVQAGDDPGPACYAASFALVLAASTPPNKSTDTRGFALVFADLNVQYALV
jgi:hypothetical protein